jgi:hypothetical protein
LENLYGDYYMVFDRYLSFLASRWRQYGNYVAYIPKLCELPYATNFKQIDEMSRCSAIPRPRLMQTPRRINHYRTYKRNETDRSWGIKFFAGYNAHNTQTIINI